MQYLSVRNQHIISNLGFNNYYQAIEFYCTQHSLIAHVKEDGLILPSNAQKEFTIYPLKTVFGLAE